MCAAFLAAGLAFGADPYGKTTLNHGTIDVWACLAIDGVNKDGDLISGTNVNISCSAGAYHRTTTFTDVQPYKAELKIEGVTIYSTENLPPFTQGSSALSTGLMSVIGPPNPGLIPGDFPRKYSLYNARFASTHFRPNTQITVSLQVWFHLYEGNPPYIVYDPISVTTTLKPKTYNRALVWTTQEEYINGQYEIPDPQPPYGCHEMGIKELEQARLYLGGDALNHEVVPVAADEANRTGAQLLAELGKATFVHGATHGTENSVRASFTDELFFKRPGNAPAASPIGVAIRSRTVNGVTYPQPNAAVMYACLTAKNIANPAEAFNLTGVDKGYLGFSAILATRREAMRNGKGESSIADHVEAFYKLLAKGETIREAAKKASKAHKLIAALSSNGRRAQELDYSGDKFARLVGVYRTKSETDNAPASWPADFKDDTQWYIWLP